MGSSKALKDVWGNWLYETDLTGVSLVAIGEVSERLITDFDHHLCKSSEQVQLLGCSTF